MRLLVQADGLDQPCEAGSSLPTREASQLPGELEEAHGGQMLRQRRLGCDIADTTPQVGAVRIHAFAEHQQLPI